MSIVEMMERRNFKQKAQEKVQDSKNRMVQMYNYRGNPTSVNADYADRYYDRGYTFEKPEQGLITTNNGFRTGRITPHAKDRAIAEGGSVHVGDFSHIVDDALAGKTANQEYFDKVLGQYGGSMSQEEMQQSQNRLNEYNNRNAWRNDTSRNQSASASNNTESQKAMLEQMIRQRQAELMLEQQRQRANAVQQQPQQPQQPERELTEWEKRRKAFEDRIVSARSPYNVQAPIESAPRANLDAYRSFVDQVNNTTNSGFYRSPQQQMPVNNNSFYQGSPQQMPSNNNNFYRNPNDGTRELQPITPPSVGQPGGKQYLDPSQGSSGGGYSINPPQPPIQTHGGFQQQSPSVLQNTNQDRQLNKNKRRDAYQRQLSKVNKY